MSSTDSSSGDDGRGGSANSEGSTRPPPRLLLPAPGGYGHRESAAAATPTQGRRIGVAVACYPCRSRKLRCDGARPVCSRCQKKQANCAYELPAGTSRQGAIRESHDVLKLEVSNYQELLSHLKNKTVDEAQVILEMIRSSEDPITVLQSIRDAESLLSGASGTPNEECDELDFGTSTRNAIQVPALPWTSVAGDDVVSELVSAWFAWEDSTLFSCITMDLFVEDMRAGDPENAAYCSPFLVDAICAAKACMDKSAAAAAGYSTSELSDQFLADAKKKLDQQNGLASLPTIQGLYCLFQHASISGIDRAGTLYRLAAIEMINRLNLTDLYATLKDEIPSQLRRKQAISKTLWAIFNVESIATSLYLRPTMFPVPTIPPYFPEPPVTQNLAAGQAFDILGAPFTENSPQPPLVRGAQYALCEISIIMNEVVSYNHNIRDSSIGESNDVDNRQQYYRRLMQFENSWSAWLRHNDMFNPQTYVLGFFVNIVAYNILRPLYKMHPDTTFEPLQGDCTSRGPLGFATTAQSFILKHATSDVKLMKSLEDKWPYHIYPFTSLFLAGPYNCATTLISLLHIPVAQTLFSKAINNLGLLQSGLPCVRPIMKGLQLVAQSVGQPIPSEAQGVFDSLDDPGDSPQNDVPVSFRVPQDEAMARLLAASPQESLDFEIDRMGSELGRLLSLYNSITTKSKI